MLDSIRNRYDSLMTRVKSTPASHTSLPFPTAPTLPFYRSYPIYTVPRVVVSRAPQLLRRYRALFWCFFGILLFCATGLIAQRFGPLLSTDESKWSYDIPNGVDTHACLPGDEWKPASGLLVNGLPYSRMATMNATLSGALAVISRGQLSAGEIVYTTSPLQKAGTASVNLQAWFQRHELMSLVKACAITRNHQPGGSGVGLFTPTWRWPGPTRLEDRMKFTTTVVLPRGNKPFPSKISGLFSDLPNTSVKMHDLADVSFSDVRLLSTNGAIEVEYLRSTQGVHVSTTNGAVSGKFDTGSSLNIRTTNDKVDVDVGLYYDGTHAVGQLDVQTTNGKIRADINLSSSIYSGGRFEINTVTSAAESLVRIRTAPSGSTLRVQSYTRNAPAELTLPSTYAGQFVAANTAFSKIRINADRYARDPSGGWRMRNLVSYPNLEDSRGHVKSGKIFWGFDSEKSNMGYAMLSTTGDMATLNM